MNSKKKVESSSSDKENEKISVLFMITSPEVTIENDHIVVSHDAHVVLFSDRPRRIAKLRPGGIKAFAEFFKKSDFATNPPNVTFAGNSKIEEKEYYAIFELESPTVNPKTGAVSFLIEKNIGGKAFVPPPPGIYSNVSLIVDNIFWIGDSSLGQNYDGEDADDYAVGETVYFSGLGNATVISYN